MERLNEYFDQVGRSPVSIEYIDDGLKITFKNEHDRFVVGCVLVHCDIREDGSVLTVADVLLAESTLARNATSFGRVPHYV